MSLDVVCFGALNVDKLYRVNKIAREEEESVITGFKEFPGGSAANTAFGLARLGIKSQALENPEKYKALQVP